MSHEVTNDVSALSNELKLAYDKAVKQFPERTAEIDAVFEAVDDLRSCIIQIDGIAKKETPHGPLSVDLIDELHSKLNSSVEAFDSFSQHSKALFTWRDTPVSWRGKPFSNVTEAIRHEALQYSWILKNGSLHNTFASSSQLRELYPEPWFDFPGVQGITRKIVERIPVKSNSALTTPLIHEGPYLGLVFHHDSTVSRIGNDYKHIPPIALAPQPLKLLKFIHEAGARGRTVNELVPAIVANKRILTTEKSRLDLSEIDIDLGETGQYMVRCTRTNAL